MLTYVKQSGISDISLTDTWQDGDTARPSSTPETQVDDSSRMSAILLLIRHSDKPLEGLRWVQAV